MTHVSKGEKDEHVLLLQAGLAGERYRAAELNCGDGKSGTGRVGHVLPWLRALA